MRDWWQPALIIDMHANESATVTHKGYARYAHNEELQKKLVDSSQAFVAMWFDKSMKPIREAIQAGIEAAGYVPQFVDTHGSAVNRIEDENHRPDSPIPLCLSRTLRPAPPPLNPMTRRMRAAACITRRDSRTG